MHNRFSTYRVFTLLFCVCCLEIFFVSKSKAQASEPDSLTYYWHKVFFAEVRNDPKAVIVCYDKIRDLCETLPLDIREWFKGTSFFGIARAKAALGDKAGARDGIAKAFSRHFWNFELVRSLTILDTLCGKEWVDSLCLYWSAVKEKEMPFWHAQPTLLLKPKNLPPGQKCPVLIVLHGGNDCYERFVTRLGALPDTLKIILVFPAGVHRLSEVTNSWDGDTTASEAKLDGLIRELTKDPMVDTTNISLFGYSQGSQIAYDYGLSHPVHIRNVVAFSGFAPAVVQPAELRDAADHKMKFIAISGTSDSPEFLKTSHQLQEEALKQGLSFDLKIEPDLPHGLPIDITGYFINIWKQLSEVGFYEKPNTSFFHSDSLQSQRSTVRH